MLTVCRHMRERRRFAAPPALHVRCSQIAGKNKCRGLQATKRHTFSPASSMPHAGSARRQLLCSPTPPLLYTQTIHAAHAGRSPALLCACTCTPSPPQPREAGAAVRAPPAQHPGHHCGAATHQRQAQQVQRGTSLQLRGGAACEGALCICAALLKRRLHACAWASTSRHAWVKSGLTEGEDEARPRTFTCESNSVRKHTRAMYTQGGASLLAHARVHTYKRALCCCLQQECKACMRVHESAHDHTRLCMTTHVCA